MLSDNFSLILQHTCSMKIKLQNFKRKLNISCLLDFHVYPVHRKQLSNSVNNMLNRLKCTALMYAAAVFTAMPSLQIQGGPKKRYPF